jgi:UDP-N-acetylmuramyl pentapeptide phosphotransferase/UDP-N-acetylglucosamine-1-phosphate transferase
MTSVLILIASFVVTYFGVAGVRAISLKRNLLDIPNERSSHVNPTPRGGGILIVIILLTFYAAVAHRFPETFSWGYVAGGLLVAGISLLDDIYGVSAIWRLLVHSLAAVLLIADKGYWHSFYFIGTSYDPTLGVAGAVVTFIWIVWLINAYNFMDGIDGIAGIQSVAAATGWFTIGWLTGSVMPFYMGGALMFSSMGFLIHNWQPAKIFMGDVGSAFLGFSFAAMPLLATANERTYVFLPMTGVLLVWLFVFDTVVTVIRRGARGERVWEAHREHLYQRLVQSGWSHARASTIYGVLAMAITVSVIYIYAEESPNLLVPVAVATLCTFFLVVAFFWKTRMVKDA